MASNWKPPSFKTDFVDVSSSLPNMRQGFAESLTVGIGTASMTKGSPWKRITAGALAGGATAVTQSLDYLRSDRAKTVVQGMKQNQIAMDERRGSK